MASSSALSTIDITEPEATLLVTARNAASNLSIAGTIVLLYDHLLLFDYERRLIWTAEWTRWKVSFLINRYVTPICLIALAYQLSTVSSETYTVTVRPLYFQVEAIET
ncbi:hypothetical protein M422DRAFT_259673 [Sphaerobolus stellatus SS14]|uniref:DUF6533 domain-containing protein n=1 Tax=Sphaerobolus stellatus (strain SS14) TaxID=990650 RepID=A0A0C9VJJ1_SPHS4|nr:hypothetical protein M422DRAFT_259673 [Sphaerobolus stellatus SS14]